MLEGKEFMNNHISMPKRGPQSLKAMRGRKVGQISRALTQQVADILGEKIISGEFQEDSLMPSERQLCESFAVSRTVVREAIKTLESRGLIRIERGRGTIVQEPQFGPLTEGLRMLIRRRGHLLDDLLEVRKVLEVHMVMRAAERRTETNIKNMERFLEEVRKSPTKPQGYVNADLEFHMEIARATQNPVLLVLLEPVSDLLIESRQLSYSGPKFTKLRAQQHEEILACIRRRDGKGAEAAMKKHLDDTECDLHRRTSSPRNRLAP
jgi:GntR family transcriptional regulator, transcriptional repressor for pyruvate dehydrogenase complex